jgi:hypothetical protein
MLMSICLIAMFCGCATRPSPQGTRIPVGLVAGKVRTIDFSSLTGSKPLIIVGVAYVTILEPESLKGKELEVFSSDDYPFRVGDEVEFDLTGVEIDKEPNGRLRTEMLYRFPIKIRSNQTSELRPERP